MMSGAEWVVAFVLAALAFVIGPIVAGVIVWKRVHK